MTFGTRRLFWNPMEVVLELENLWSTVSISPTAVWDPLEIFPLEDVLSPIEYYGSEKLIILLWLNAMMNAFNKTEIFQLLQYSSSCSLGIHWIQCIESEAPFDFQFVIMFNLTCQEVGDLLEEIYDSVIAWGPASGVGGRLVL